MPSRMVRIAKYNLLEDAQLFAASLSASGIAAEVRGQGSPLASLGIGQVEVYVPEADLGRARELYEATIVRSDGASPRACPHCGEESPASFESCWQCGKDL